MSASPPAHRAVPGDVLRATAALSVLLAAVEHSWIGLALMALVLGGTMIPRAAGLPHSVDVLYSSVLLAAAWSALLDLYQRWPTLDLLAHTLVTAWVALVGVLLVQKAELLSPALSRTMTRGTLFVSAVLIGVTLSVLWEIGEWLGHTFLDERIQVGYDDTMTDIIAGLCGSLWVGLAVALRHAPDRRARPVTP